MMFFSSLASKLVAIVFSGLALNPVTTISLGLALKSVVGFLIEPQNQGGGVFLDLGLKISSYGLVIWASKSPRWFLSLCLKTKHAIVCWLGYKIDGGTTA
jgi:hypothetical protein